MARTDSISAYAAAAAKQILTPFPYAPAALGPQDVEIAISHCGICHSDIHMLDDDWQMTEYPFVPGHEIVGTVAAHGDEAAHLALGQRVGVGWQRSACHTCEACLTGREQLCAESIGTIVGHHGGFADRIRIDARFAFPIPEALPSESAAPLLCAGVTVFSPLQQFEVSPTSRVGVVGVGGLGHLALQFAKAWGCEVTAFSGSANKESEARELGADHFVLSSNAGAMECAANSIDFLLDTVSADIDWALYLNTLRIDGTLCVLGVPNGNLSIPAFPLITGRRRIVGSPTGGRQDITEMLAFAARHGIRAKTEVLPIAQVNEAIQKVRENRARYRMVLSTDTV